MLSAKNCAYLIQAVDKYKNGLSDIMNMRLKHAISMTDLRPHTTRKNIKLIAFSATSGKKQKITIFYTYYFIIYKFKRGCVTICFGFRMQKSPNIELRPKIIGGRISTVVLIIAHASIARYY